MSKLIEMVGRRFGKLTVVSRADNSKDGKTRWNCICDCGNSTVVSATNLRTSNVKSCGCARIEFSQKNTFKHGETRTRLYNTWCKMRYRCEKEYDPSYKNYGGRGIKVCDEWDESFELFRDWALESGYNDDLTIERIDVNGNYCPENCTWVPFVEQANNRRSCIWITYNGKTQNLKQWCDELNLSYRLIRDRIKRSGMTFENAISIPLQNKKSHRKE